MRMTIMAGMAALTLAMAVVPSMAEDLRPVAVDGPVTLGYQFPEYVDIAASYKYPGYGVVYTDSRTYWVEMASRRVVLSPGAPNIQPDTVTYVGAGKSAVFTGEGKLAAGLVLTPEANILSVPGESYGYMHVDGRVVFVDMATRTVISVQ